MRNDYFFNYFDTFLLKTAAATFYEAELDCQGMGAHLISIHSEKEYLIFKRKHFQRHLIIVVNCCKQSLVKIF